MINYIEYDSETMEVNNYSTVDDDLFSRLPVITNRVIVESSPKSFYHRYYYSNGSLVAYTEQELAYKRKPPTGYIFKLPERELQDIRTLAEAKAAKWTEIKRLRYTKEVGTFIYNSQVFHADKGHIGGATQLAVLAKAASQPFSMDWTLYDNTVVTLNADQMIAVGTALGIFVNSLYTTARLIREDIEACTTNAQVDAIVWPT